jgi:type II secretory pathway pseudopilin PulG
MRRLQYAGAGAMLALAGLLLPRASAHTAAPSDSLDQVRHRLRALVTAQESYYSQHGTYTTDLAALRLFTPGVRDSIWIRVIHAGGRSWTADGAHRALKGKSCVIRIGVLEDFPSLPQTAATGLPPAREGDPVCDLP